MKTSYRRMLTAVGMVLLASGTPLFASEADKRIESSFKESYVFKTYLADDAVKVESKDGAVTLSGTVNEQSDRGLALETATNLPGVKSVDNRLEIKTDYPPQKSNERLAIDIKSMLLFHRNVSMEKTQIYVEEGIVTLRGEAANEAQKELTAEYADVEGIREVRNEMMVAKAPKTAEQTRQGKIDDASITGQVKMALLTHRSTSTLKTSVATKAGIVAVDGKVQNAAQKDLVTTLVSDIYGVNGVVNNMTQEKTEEVPIPAPMAEKTPSDLFLSPNVQDNPFFVTALRNQDDKVYLEKIKIRYLMEAVKRSPLTFIRNNKAYRGTEAAAHLSWKYSLAGQRVQTTHDFIEGIASQSIQTGNRYLVRSATGNTYPLRDVLYNELERLEQSLKSKK